MTTDLATLNQPKDLVTEIPTPQKEIKRADELRYDVPIMIEITQQDLDQAGDYTSCDNCLIATALKRMGYNVYSVNPERVQFGDWPNFIRFYSDEIDPESLASNNCGSYRQSVVGKQIILYPKHERS